MSKNHYVLNGMLMSAFNRVCELLTFFSGSETDSMNDKLKVLARVVEQLEEHELRAVRTFIEYHPMRKNNIQLHNKLLETVNMIDSDLLLSLLEEDHEQETNILPGSET